MLLRIFILFFISLSLNAAEVVWDQESAKKVQKISDSDYQAALDSYLAELTANPKKAFEKGLQAEEQAEYKSALYFYRLSADKDHTPAKHNIAFLYARNLGISQADKESIEKQTLEAQRILNKLNYNTGTIDGIYGLTTFNAIKSFQKDNASEPTGWIDSELLSELSKAEKIADHKAKIAQELRDAQEAQRLQEAQKLREEQKAKELANILETQQLLKNLAYYFGPLAKSA